MSIYYSDLCAWRRMVRAWYS